MAGAPAKCNDCGHIFESTAIQASSNVKIAISGMSTNCPKCGGTAPFVEGTLRYPNVGMVEPVIAPPLSREIIEKLKRMAESLKVDESSEEEVIAQVTAISPELAKTITPYVKRRGILFVIFVITWIIAHINFETSVKTNIEIDGKINLNDLFAYAVNEVDKQTSLASDSRAAVNANEPKQSLRSPGTPNPTKPQLRRIRGRTKRTRPRPAP
jgi:hypothetical protein